VAVQPQWIAEDHSRNGRRLERWRLLQTLDEADAQAIVLCAPAGYGKSVLAAQWLRDRRGTWFRAAPAGPDLVPFAFELARAAAEVVPAASARLRDTLRGAAAAPGVVARAFAEALADWPPEAWLAIEDYHVAAACDTADALVDRLLELTPVRLLVTTRRRPRWCTARRILYGDVVQLGRDELSMTAEEAAAVAGPHAAELDELLDRAQGWPAVVGLAARAAARMVAPAQVEEMLFRYVADEVLRHEPPAVQQLMLALAVPPAVDAHTVERILGTEDRGATLARLEQDGLLTAAPDGTLCFHPVVRDVLLRMVAARRRAAASVGIAGLTRRENEVLALMAEGLANRAIAKRLFISEKTTKTHIGHIFDKLGVESRVQAVLVAQKLVS
jgi:LuxR family transcriptional regulator, maltose regulon positive regulatory protein